MIHLCLTVTAVISQKREGRWREVIIIQMDRQTLQQLVRPDPGAGSPWKSTTYKMGSPGCAPLILPNNMALLEAAMFLMMSPQNHS